MLPITSSYRKKSRYTLAETRKDILGLSIIKVSNLSFHISRDVQFKSRKSDDQKYELKNVFLDEICSMLLLSVSEAHADVINNLESLVESL